MTNKSVLTLRCALGFVVASLLVGIPQASAQSTSASLCQSSGGYVIGFFNGVWNTFPMAVDGRNAIRAINGDTYSDGTAITYDLFYNQTGTTAAGLSCPESLGLHCFEDLVETFKQRAAAQGGVLSDRWEHFWEILRGRTGSGSLTGQVTNAIGGLVDVVRAIDDTFKAQTTATLVGLASSPPTLQDYAEHKTRLDAHMSQRERIVLVAHSQGNLFMNVAYEYGVGVVGTDAIKTVHIAPASPNVHGDYALADLDLVINGLRAFGTVPPSNVSIPLPMSRPLAVDSFGKVLAVDWSGHELISTYLNESLATHPLIKIQLARALASVQTPTGTGSTGFFTVTLTWNGSGDVDLHTTEPDNTHVYYGSEVGNSGALDVDNTFANGPEHYFASCDPAQLQIGTYQFGINDYAQASGRTATVQVASFQKGVLLTKSLDVGAPRGSAGNSSPLPVFSVTVSKDSLGEYSVTAQ